MALGPGEIAGLRRRLQEDPASTGAVDASAQAQPLTDFDALLHSLGAPDASPPPAMEKLLSGVPVGAPAERVLPPAPPDAPADEAFARLEGGLRAFNWRRDAPVETDAAVEDILAEELDAWLRALLAARPDSSAP